MTNHGDDCFFFYYSTCSKGDDCPFRHCEAAMGNETVCNFWQEGCCFRKVCKFRHMEITKNRKEIPCYWETQPAGCQKPHCAFFHERPRPTNNEEQRQVEPATPPAAPLPTTANPQLRGVIKTETQELVPSPTHPPVVINPADDDEDEDDLMSEEGEDGKCGPSPRKHSKIGSADKSLNFGVSTLEEIRLRRALKASMKRVGYPIQSAQTSANGGKENIQDCFQPPLFEPYNEPQGSVVERLGQKIPYGNTSKVEGLPLKRSLAERLGGVMDSEQPPCPPHKSLKPIKERLGLYSDGASSSLPVQSIGVSTKAPEQIRIKTLDEIRRAKAAKSQAQSEISSPAASEALPVKVLKRSITVKDTPISHVKTSSETIQKKRKQEAEETEQCNTSEKAKNTLMRSSVKRPLEAKEGEAHAQFIGGREVKVKTLEEIRKEKAARTEQATATENKPSADTEDDTAKRSPLLRIKRPAPHSSVSVEKDAAVTQKAAKTAAAGGKETNNVKVKSFEEIMREKQLRKQEEQATSSAAGESPQHQLTAAGCRKRKLSPHQESSTSPPSTSPVSDSNLSRIRVSTNSRIRAKNATDSNADPNAAAVKESPTEAQSKNAGSISSPSPVKQARAASQGPAVEEITISTQSHPTLCPTNTKVRPKLKVKPSVVKPAVRAKPGQKKKRAKASAVAAVRPLSSTSSVHGAAGAASTQPEVLPSSLNGEAQPSCASRHSRTSRLVDSGSSSDPLRQKRDATPVVQLNHSLDSKSVSSLPKSPVPKSIAQPKSRRSSSANRSASATSAYNATATAVDEFDEFDEFDELMDEFTDPNLEDMDPEIGEDDLLKELSEMIDS